MLKSKSKCNYGRAHPYFLQALESESNKATWPISKLTRRPARETQFGRKASTIHVREAVADVKEPTIDN